MPGIPLVRFFETYDRERVVPGNRLEREQKLREFSRRLCDGDLRVLTELTKVLIDG